MLKKGTVALLALAGGSGAILLYRRLRKQGIDRRRKEMQEYIEKGNHSLKTKIYSEAVIFYLKALTLLEKNDEEAMNIYNSLVICFVKLKTYREALVYVDRSLAINVLNNEKALKWRYECHRILEMRRETLCDAFLCGLVTKEERYRKLAQDILKSEAENEAKKRTGINGATPSSIIYGNFFSTFPGLFGDEPFVKDGLIKLIQNKEYERALKSAENKGDPIAVFVTAAINHVNGKDILAISLLEHEKMIFSICLREYLKSLYGQAPMDMDDFVDKNSANTSVLFYAAKTHFNLGRLDLYEKFINLAIDSGEYDFLYVDKIACAGRVKSYELHKVLEDALRKHPESVSILSIACEYYLRTEELEKLEDALSKMEEKHDKDPRPLLFRGVLAQARNDLDGAERYLRLAIELDKKYFKPYVYLGGILLGRNDGEAKTIYKKALGCATTYDEIFTAEQALILLDVQDKILEVYPDVLKSL